jgi:hypothetical protein
VRTGDAKTWERVHEKRRNHGRGHSDVYVVELDDSVSIRSYVDIKAFCDLEFTRWCSVKFCYILNEIGVDSQREIESSSKYFDCCSSLKSDTKSSFKGCRSRRACDRQAVSLTARATN